MYTDIFSYFFSISISKPKLSTYKFSTFDNIIYLYMIIYITT